MWPLRSSFAGSHIPRGLLAVIHVPPQQFSLASMAWRRWLCTNFVGNGLSSPQISRLDNSRGVVRLSGDDIYTFLNVGSTSLFTGPEWLLLLYDDLRLLAMTVPAGHHIQRYHIAAEWQKGHPVLGLPQWPGPLPARCFPVCNRCAAHAETLLQCHTTDVKR